MADSQLTQVSHWTLQTKLALPIPARQDPPFSSGVLYDESHQRLQLDLSLQDPPFLKEHCMINHIKG